MAAPSRLSGLSPQQRAQVLRELRAARAGRGPQIPPVPREGRLPLSFAQQRLWFLDRLDPGAATYKAPYAIRIAGPVDESALGVAITGMFRRHEPLRTRFADDDGVPYCVIDPAAETVPVRVTDLTGQPVTEREQRLREVMDTIARRPVDLAAGPLVRPELVRLSAEDRVLVLDMHHITTDAWSVGVLQRELFTLYQAAVAGVADPLPPLAVQYVDFAAWQRDRLSGDELAEHLGYWRNQLADLPVLDLPADRPRPAVASSVGAGLIDTCSPALHREVRGLAERCGTRPFAVLLAAFVALLHRLTGADDVAVGSAFSGRTRSEIEPLLGFFVNTLVLRADVSGDPSFTELLARVDDMLLNAHAHQEVPFDLVVDAVAGEREPGRNPLFDVAFNYQDATITAGVGTEGLRVSGVGLSLGTSRFDLTLNVGPAADGGLTLAVEYSSQLFEAGRIEQLVANYRGLLSSVLVDPGARLSTVDLSAGDGAGHPVDWSGAEVAAPEPAGTVPEQIVARARTAPDAVAVRFDGATMTYRQLVDRADRMARVLAAHGVGPESRVGVLLERGPELIVALLAVWRAGGAYVPLDPTLPPARLEFIARDAGCVLVLTSITWRSALPEGTATICVDELAGLPARAVSTAVDHDQLAYVIYTSGSTGTPKGVGVSHGNVATYLAIQSVQYGLSTADKMVQFCNPSFDVSVHEIFGALVAGATLVCAPREVVTDPEGLTALLVAERVTVAAIAPAMLALLEPSDFPDLRHLMAAGEPFGTGLADAWAQGREFYNGYGPTEATVVCVQHRCAVGGGTAAPPIGRPLPGVRVYLVDRWGSLVPPGVPGEAWVGGVQVSRGYLGRPGLTAERFVPDPFSGVAGARLYRTGDLMRWSSDGTLWFTGRLDDQVKIRGQRVELGEVRAVLAEHPAVAQALAVVTDGALVAYLVADGAAPSVDELRAYLGARLPSVMVPAAFVVLDALPVNANGKLDRLALPKVGGARPDLGTRFVEPSTDTERVVAGVWHEILAVDRIGVDDNFFALGGNSLQATRVMSRINSTTGANLPLRVFFAGATVAQLARQVDEAQPPTTVDTLAALDEIEALSDEEIHSLLDSADGAS